MAENQVKPLNTYNGRRDGTPLMHTCLDTKTLVGKEPLTRTPTLLGVFKTHILYKYLQNFTIVQPFQTYVIDFK